MLEAYQPFILQTASFVLKRYVSQSDDAWSIALIAFWEAVNHYDQSKGCFEAFARLVMQRRLIDDLRKQRKYGLEIDVAPDAFAGDMEPEPTVSEAYAALRSNAVPQSESELKEEIAEAGDLLAPYGFRFMELVECSPKSEKTKKACTEAVLLILRSPDLMGRMQASHRLPIQTVAERTGVSHKVINRHRRYIIAVAEIMNGDFPRLKTYLQAAVRE